MELFSSILNADIAYNVTFTGFLLIICAAIVCGIALSGTYLYHRRYEMATNGMAFIMVLVPVAAAIVILMVGRNIAAGLGLSGLFVLVRFRSGPIEIRDLAYLFTAICSGILNGSGYVAYGVIFTVIMVLLIFVLEKARWGNQYGDAMLLKIWIPESLNYQGVFEEVLEKYTDFYKLLMVRTTDFGSNCELRYRILAKKDVDQKEMIDEIRSRNGNMNVVLVVAPQIVEKSGKQVL